MHNRAISIACLLLILTILTFIGCAFYTINDSWIVDPDSAAYMGLAKSLLAGEGYSFAGVPHTKYPPFFPLLLSLVSRIGDDPCYDLMQYLVAGFWVLLCGLAFLLFSGSAIADSPFSRKGIPKNTFTGLLFAFFAAGSIYMLQYATVFLRSEIIFTFFSLGACWMALQLLQKEKPAWSRWILFLLFFQCAYFTRMAGIALLGALVLVVLFEKRQWIQGKGRWIPALALIALCALGPALWMERNQNVRIEGSTDYASEFLQEYGLDLTKNHDLEMDTIGVKGFAWRIAGNISVFCESCAKMLLNSNKGGSRSVLKWGFGLICFFGMLISLVGRRSFVDYYCLLYICLYFVWPFNQQQRFYLPILPFLIEYMVIALLHLNKLLPSILRHKGFWYLFFALQVPLLVVIFCGRSQQPDVLDRYSYPYLAFALLITVVMLILDVYFFMERSRPGGVKFLVKTSRMALVLLYLCGFAFFGLQGLHSFDRSHEFFLEHRAGLAQEGKPVAERFDKIEAHPELINLATMIIEITNEEDVIMSDVPKMMYMLTGRTFVPFTFHGKQNRLAEEVNGLRPSYVCYSGEIGWVYHVFKAACKDFEMIFSHRVDVGGGEMIEPGLYRIKPE